jgi:hypothetical protein
MYREYWLHFMGLQTKFSSVDPIPLRRIIFFTWKLRPAAGFRD